MINIRKLEAELWDKVLNGKTVTSLEDALQKQKTEAKQLIADAPRKDKKRIEAEQNALIAEIHAELAKLNQEANVLMDEI